MIFCGVLREILLALIVNLCIIDAGRSNSKGKYKEAFRQMYIANGTVANLSKH